jgi:preprotein translocase subunit SecG
MNLKQRSLKLIRCAMATLTQVCANTGGFMRRLAGLLIMIFLAGILVVGCGKKEEAKPAKPAAEKAAAETKEPEVKKEPEKQAETPKAPEVKPRETKPGEAMPAAEKPGAEKK